MELYKHIIITLLLIILTRYINIIKVDNNIVIFLLLIVTIFVTREITIYFYKKSDMSPNTEVLGPTITLKDNFGSMFEKTSPWPGLNQTIFGQKGSTIKEENNGN